MTVLFKRGASNSSSSSIKSFRLPDELVERMNKYASKHGVHSYTSIVIAALDAWLCNANVIQTNSEPVVETKNPLYDEEDVW